MIIMVIHWLHLQDQISSRCVDIGWVENGRVCFKSTRCLMPSARVKCIEVISPVEDKFSSGLIVIENLNVVIEDVPWHVMWVEAITPGVESRGPEVHSEGLGLLHKLNGGITGWNMADFMSVNSPRNVIWGPGHFISVPVCAWLEVMGVVV